MSIVMADLGKSRNGTQVIRYDRIRNGPFFADFRRDKCLYPEVYHCIIQREGSTQILSWSQYRSLERAMLAAELELKHLAEAEALKTEKHSQTHEDGS